MVVILFDLWILVLAATSYILFPSNGATPSKEENIARQWIQIELCSSWQKRLIIFKNEQHWKKLHKCKKISAICNRVTIFVISYFWRNFSMPELTRKIKNLSTQACLWTTHPCNHFYASALQFGGWKSTHFCQKQRQFSLLRQWHNELHSKLQKVILFHFCCCCERTLNRIVNYQSSL